MSSWLSQPPLPFGHALATVTVAGLACHTVFRRLEPRSLLVFGILLALIPALLTPLFLPHASSVFTAMLYTFAVYLLSLVSSVVIYRLSPFHPLAKYPGPLIGRISKVWFAVIALSGKQHLYYKTLHERYGDVVRIGPNELSFRHVDSVNPMLGIRGMPKGEYWDGRAPENAVRPLLALRDPKEHARRRRAWNRAFSTPQLREYQAIVEARINQLLDILTGKTDQSIDLSKWLGWLTLDIMNDLMFSNGGDAMEFLDQDNVVQLLMDAQPMALLMSHLPWISDFYLWVPGVGRGLRDFRKYAARRASERKARGSDRKDVFYHLIDEAGLEPSPPSNAQVTSDGGLAIIAGAETTSTTLSHAFYLLLCNPKTYTRLQAEIDDPKMDSGVPASQARMPYLNAVINETLRLFPAVLSGSQRTPPVGSGGQTISSHFVPEGTSTVVHTYSLHHDPRYFSPLPDSFVPERWLSSEQQLALEPDVFRSGEVVHNTAAFIPFSVGPSNCVGRNLAYQEMRMVLCMIMSHFEMRFEESFDVHSWEDNLRDYFVVQRGQLPVVLKARTR
ncbi:hypothetical protein HMN09_00445100 [Mycena chlorophos]|uniref:Cytochrome P450 n=1 Tax=Mycena chlorophos TaxID=658473 RepID=A0A8H6TH29_MYCCL|nr:hypothetical protein HMN09_00445100 [Mycena chlorophos]